jgi:hypothetical protein
MSKGLTKTLLAVAVGMMAVVQAYAAAPVIKNIPSPVVGDQEVSTPENYFVYPDAIDLTAYVTDDTSSAAEILWSYDIVGTPRYMINGVDPGPADPVAPGALQINNQVLQGEDNPDANPATITIRDIILSPIGGPYTAPSGQQSQVVTLYASDEDLFDSADVMFYTEAGLDHLTGGPDLVWEGTFEGSLDGFTYTFGSGSTTSSTEGGHALCLVVPNNQTANTGWWSGTMGMLELVKNNVYRVRALLNGSQAGGGTASNVPFFDLIINNFQVDTTATPYHGMNLYGANYFILDNANRANAVVEMGSGLTDGKNFDMWWCPSSISTAQWNVETDGATSGPFAPENATDDGLGHGKDSFMEFRVLDTPDNPGTTGNSDYGTLCMRNLKIERWDLDTVAVDGSALYEAASITTSSHRREGTDFNMSADGTLTPTTAGQTNGLTGVVPGDGVIDYGNGASITDDYPVAMDAQSLYLVTMSLSAPSAAAESSPPEVMWLGADTVTNELIFMSYVTFNCNMSAMPKTTAQDYKCLFWSNYGTDASNPTYFAQLRPRFMVANVGLNPSTSTGGIKINNMKVEKVTFSGM